VAVVPGPQLIAVVVAPPFAGEIAETDRAHGVEQQAAAVANRPAVVVAGIFVVAGVRTRRGFVEQAAHVQPAAVAVAQADIHRAAGQVRARRIGAGAWRGDEFAGAPRQFGRLGIRFVLAEDVVERVV
jgi:hypothetical protein